MGKKNHRYGKNDHTHGITKRASENKGKSCEEIFGEEEGRRYRKKMSKIMSGRGNGMYGRKHPKNKECPYCGNMFSNPGFTQHEPYCKKKLGVK